jgi:DNA polymerase I-like protein with 3'-5' exonuclease and polymerase domains/intein/homing endonuclease
MAFGYVLNENKVNLSDDGYGLKDMARNLLRFFHYDDKTLEARSKGNLLDLPLESPVPRGRPGWVPNLTDYGGMDAYVTRRLFIALKAEALQHHYYDRAIGLLEYLFSNTYRLLSRLERNGFWANLSHLNMLKDPIRSPIFLRLAEIDKVEVRKFDSAKKANAKLARKKSHGSRSLFGDPWVLDLNKPDHVRAWLIDQCKLEPVEKTESGLASVGKRFFQEYKDTVPEVALVEERRGLAKLATSYVNQLIEYIDPRYRNDSDATTRDRNEDCLDGRVRPDFWFTSTVTGRGSATNPNMQQQVRADSPEKAAIKAIFQAEQPGIQESFKIDFKKGPPKLLRPDAPPENCLVQLDFKTNEVRWWAILSGDPNLVKAFNNGKELLDQLRLDPFNADLKQRADLAGDIHKQTASQMFGVRIEDVKKDQRTGAKCLVGDTILFTGQGVLPIEQLVGDDPISIASSEGPRTATKVWKTKMSSTTCVRTQYGYELEGTPDHRVQVLAPDLSLEWRRLDSLTPDDHVVISTNNDVWPQQRVMLPEFDYDKENPTDHCHTRLIRTPKEPRVVDEALARLLGYMVSEGTCGGEAVCFSNSDALLLSDFTACYASCFGDMSATQTICNHKGDSVDRIDLRRYPSSFLRWVGIGSVLSGGQSVPDCILRSPKDVVREFLRAYFEGDGSSCSSANKTDTVRASSASRLLLRQIQMLLLNFGVVSRLYAERRPLPKSGEKRLYHILDVTAENFDLFHERIGFVTARKNTRPTQRNRYGAKIPYAKQHLHVGKGHYFGGWTPSKTITYGYLTRNLAVIGDLCKAGHEVIAGRLQNIIDNRYYFARVESVEHCEHQKPVYDVFVPDGHKFVGNGYSAHNSIVFGWMFGRGTPAIAAQIHKSVEETEKLVKMFGDTFCVGRDWLHSQPDLARRLWYVESPIGRRRRLPGYIILPSGFVGHDLKQLSQDDRRTIGECDRMAKNSVIQGVASDAAFIGGALFADYIEDNGLPWLVQNVVHDSCIYQVPITDLEESVRVAEETFTTKTMGYMHDKFGVDFPCPIEVDFDFGLTWGHLHKWDMTAPSLAAIKAELLGRTGASSTT